MSNEVYVPNAMELYIGTKLIKAYPMTRGDYNNYRGWTLPEGEDGNDEGYLVEYMDSPNSNHSAHENYISWSPQEVFERAYQITEGLSFGLAIEAMKTGQRVSRKGWNGKDMYLWLMPEAEVKAEWCKEPHLKELAEGNGGSISALGTIRMKTADNKILTGWLASQTDMLSTDWFIV
jgi:hypothetical protein